MYLYHAVPPNMRGNILYPLNELKMFHPDLYEQQVGKYQGCEEVKQRRIPPLRNSLWNDVLFLTAVSPASMQEAWEEAQMPPRFFRFFRFPLTTIDPTYTVVYKWRKPRDTELTEFRERDVWNYAKVPQATLHYWRRERAKGNNPLTFLYIPHILHKGPIDVSQAEIVMA